MMKKLKIKIMDWIIFSFSLLKGKSKKGNRSKLKVGFLVEEFFHEDLRGFGGFGITTKRICNFLNKYSHTLNAEVLLSSMLKFTKPKVVTYHDTEVVFRSNSKQKYLTNFIKYGIVVNKRQFDFLMSIDWYNSYEYVLRSLPTTPAVIWLRDPRGIKEWETIASVPLEVQVSGDSYKDGNIERIVAQKKDSFHKSLSLSQRYKRKLIFATAAQCLVPRAQRALGLSHIDAVHLHNPIEIPEFDRPHFSKKPSVCFVARLQPIKRPWIFCELAKRFSHVDFFVAGVSHNPDVMDPILDKYRDVKNLKFLGLVTGKEKQDLFNNCWAMINTSIGEGLPCTFLEAFSYGKQVVACLDPDKLVSRFGYYTGMVLGNGMEPAFLDKFSDAIEQVLSNEGDRIDKGIQARKYIEEYHTFEKFTKNIHSLILPRLFENQKRTVNVEKNSEEVKVVL